MRRTEPKSVADIINQVLREANLDVRLDEHRAEALWPKIVGDGVAGYTVSVEVRSGVMTVRLSSSTLRNELMMSRSVLRDRINAALGREVISQLVFR